MRNVNTAVHSAPRPRPVGAPHSRHPIKVGDHTVSQERLPTTALLPEFQLQHVMLGAPPSDVGGPASERLNGMLSALEELPAFPV